MPMSHGMATAGDLIAAWTRQPSQMARRFVIDACTAADHGSVVDGALHALQRRNAAPIIASALDAIVDHESIASAASSAASETAAPPQLTAPKRQACHVWSMLARDPWALLWALLAGALPSDDDATQAQRAARLAV